MVGIHLSGSFGQSQELYEARNAWKRGRTHDGVVNEILARDTKTALKAQEGLDFIIDPLLQRYHIFEPLRHSIGISEGPQENYFDNNVFFRRPRIAGPLPKQIVRPYTALADKEAAGSGRGLAILPSPFTTFALSDVSGYDTPEHAIYDIALRLRFEAVALRESGYTRLQFDEPALVQKSHLGTLTPQDTELVRLGSGIVGDIHGATTVLHTYFAPADKVLGLLGELPFDAIGIDCTETDIGLLSRQSFQGKELVLGLLDARTTAQVDARKVAKQAKQIEAWCRPSALYIAPTTGTEYRGWTHSLRTIENLKEVRDAFSSL